MKSLRILFVLAAVLLLAPASAMAVFSLDVCSENAPSDVLDPGFPFDHADNVEECKKLCRVQGRVCAQVAKTMVGCWNKDLAGQLKGEAIDCNDEENPSACKQEVQSWRKSVKGSLKATLESEREDCKSYVDFCTNNCEGA